MGKRDYDEDRRNTQRFQVSWEVAVKGTDRTGASFDQVGTLKNLSSLGAFLHLARRMDLGERLELQVSVPFKRNNWVSYRAQVVRVEHTGTRAGVAVKFDTARPVFIEG